MLTGEPPFGGRAAEKETWARTAILRAHRDEQPRPPSELNPKVSSAVERVVLRALEKKPERRFNTAADFLRALRRARGREPGAVSSEEYEATAALDAKPTGVINETTDELLHDPYHTQPIVTEFCPACGEEVKQGEGVCSRCGHDLTASPATAELARKEFASRGRGQGLKLFAVVAALLVLLASLVYLVGLQRRSGASAGEESAGPANTAAAPAAASPTPSPVSPPPASVLLEAGAKVDSSFDGYGAKPLTDGVTDVRQVKAMRYNQGNWVSAESPDPHWVELDFKRPARVTAVYVYWGFDKDRYMPSRQLELQAPDGRGGWRTVSRLAPGENFDRAAFEFDPLETTSLRVLQPAQAGPPNRPFVMWLREVQAFGTYDK
jgi:hypothetical protein